MSYRVLVAVESCFKDCHKHQAQRDTWGKDLFVTEKKFFIGNAGVSPFKDEIFLGLGIDDSYDTLSLKTQAMCRWALKHDFDFMFKCDTDTVINPLTFIFSQFPERYDYMGGFNEDYMPNNLRNDFPYNRIEFASGGAGYWLSRKALTVIAEYDTIPSCAEDVFVASVLKKSGILPVWNSGYRWKPGETIDKDVVTLHLSSALQKKYETRDMYDAYLKIKGTI